MSGFMMEKMECPSKEFKEGRGIIICTLLPHSGNFSHDESVGRLGG